MDNNWLVIACGNPLRGDDGFGWRVAEALEEANLSGLEVVACHQFMPEQVARLNVASHVVFVDVSIDLEPGQLRCTSLEPKASSLAFSHQFEPPQLLALSEQLYGRVPEAKLLAVGARQFELGEQLSAPLEEAVTAAVDLIQRWCHEPGLIPSRPELKLRA